MEIVEEPVDPLLGSELRDGEPGNQEATEPEETVDGELSCREDLSRGPEDILGHNVHKVGNTSVVHVVQRMSQNNPHDLSSSKGNQSFKFHRYRNSTHSVEESKTGRRGANHGLEIADKRESNEELEELRVFLGSVQQGLHFSIICKELDSSIINAALYYLGCFLMWRRPQHLQPSRATSGSHILLNITI